MDLYSYNISIILWKLIYRVFQIMLHRENM